MSSREDDRSESAGPGQRPLPDLHALQLLVTVAETGSLGRAAARLRISQPSASARIRTLERRLGLHLLDRSTSGSRLSPAGAVVTDWARTVLEQAEALVEGAAALRSRQDNRLHVAASLTIAEELMPGWLVTLREGAPGAHVGLTVTNSWGVIEALRRGECDLGFVEGPRVPDDLHRTAVGRDRLAVVVAPGHPWTRRRTPLSGRELADTPLLVREPGSGTRETLVTALRQYDGIAVPVLELGSTAPLRSAAARGLAPAVLSVLAVREDLDLRRLVEIEVDPALPLRRVLHAVWPKGRELPEPALHLLRAAGRA
ncbi:LysR substrate-binding domain-containing protein [Streptomyces sp. NBC_01387]|uniref:LysR substrate-binding domain-containing protein n=1 Tax=unclassified Streptomyces TaxID=2593676 RepID=UPI00202451DD|nr:MULTISPECIES: LysR substrate-binding domain-containing protein [unclassified Streptomyces]MCX4549185.1 LysR substrate-binding domain-containing protein [Streptomyces sp. NBC_01500]WSC20756.1 LysR substrate-binding domain-containing protein [Streptomyces sp. NBC_01766]WSV54783.1 LysR substrate-binding domain-containing protein [Streptomyces sp. NBC_01014]